MKHRLQNEADKEKQHSMTNGLWNLEFGIPLPVKDPSGKFINLVLELPSGDSVKEQLNLVTEEYFDLLHSFFSSIKTLLSSSEIQRE